MSELTPRQLKAIPFIVTSPTYTQGMRKAKVDRSTFYKWLKQPEFKAELDRQRGAITAEAFGILSQSLTKAVETLARLLDHKDDRLKRLTAKDIIEYFVRYQDNEKLLQRIEAIERMLAERALEVSRRQ